MSDVTTTIDTYLEAYGEPGAERRQELIRKVWAADGHLIDPPLDARGHDGIDGGWRGALAPTVNAFLGFYPDTNDILSLGNAQDIGLDLADAKCRAVRLGRLE